MSAFLLIRFIFTWHGTESLYNQQLDQECFNKGKTKRYRLYITHIHLILGVNILSGLAWCQMVGAGGDVDFLQLFQGLCVEQVDGGALGEGHPNPPT